MSVNTVLFELFFIMKFKKQEVKHIAELARLALSEDELKIYGKQLSDILAYVDELKEVDTTDVELTAQVTGLKNVFREDEINGWDKVEREAALKEAPELADKQIKVKRVLG